MSIQEFILRVIGGASHLDDVDAVSEDVCVQDEYMCVHNMYKSDSFRVAKGIIGKSLRALHSGDKVHEADPLINALERSYDPMQSGRIYFPPDVLGDMKLEKIDTIQKFIDVFIKLSYFADAPSADEYIARRKDRHFVLDSDEELFKLRKENASNISKALLSELRNPSENEPAYMKALRGKDGSLSPFLATATEAWFNDYFTVSKPKAEDFRYQEVLVATVEALVSVLNAMETDRQKSIFPNASAKPGAPAVNFEINIKNEHNLNLTGSVMVQMLKNLSLWVEILESDFSTHIALLPTLEVDPKSTLLVRQLTSGASEKVKDLRDLNEENFKPFLKMVESGTGYQDWLIRLRDHRYLNKVRDYFNSLLQKISDNFSECSQVTKWICNETGHVVSSFDITDAMLKLDSIKYCFQALTGYIERCCPDKLSDHGFSKQDITDALLNIDRVLDHGIQNGIHGVHAVQLHRILKGGFYDNYDTCVPNKGDPRFRSGETKGALNPNNPKRQSLIEEVRKMDLLKEKSMNRRVIVSDKYVKHYHGAVSPEDYNGFVWKFLNSLKDETFLKDKPNVHDANKGFVGGALPPFKKKVEQNQLIGIAEAYSDKKMVASPNQTSGVKHEMPKSGSRFGEAGNAGLKVPEGEQKVSHGNPFKSAEKLHFPNNAANADWSRHAASSKQSEAIRGAHVRDRVRQLNEASGRQNDEGMHVKGRGRLDTHSGRGGARFV